MTPERRQAVRVGKLVVVAHEDTESLTRLAERLTASGYGIQQTPHFVICQKGFSNGRIILMHTYSEATVDEDLSRIIGDELGPLGLAASPRTFGETLFAVVASTCPVSLHCTDCGRLHLDHGAIWRHFCLNTLERLRTLLVQPPSTDHIYTSHIALFAFIYRRIMESYVGESLLDVGSNLGLLPVLLAERDPQLTIVGCDNRPEAVSSSTDLAAATNSARVSFQQRDVLASNFAEIGRFDTVTAVHLLEHLTEEQLAVALAHLLDATERRLIVSVPYEETVQPLYGHQQVFNSEKLQRWGEWCVEVLGGGGRFWREDVGGGFLVVERAVRGQ